MPINNFRNITTTGFDEDALATTTDHDKVRNFAALTTTGDLANGIYAGADNVSIDNFGHIETNGNGAEGVLIEGAGARVRNFGSIVTHGDPTDDFLHFNDAIAVYGDHFQVENWGHVQADGFISSGVFAFGDGGLIRNFGSISAAGAGAFAITAGGNGNRVVNFGEIHIDDPNGLAIDATGAQNEVVNFGVITGGGVFAGTFFGASALPSIVTNWGVIAGVVGQAMVGNGRGSLVQNFGTIDVTGDAMRAAGDIGVEVRNTGTITTHGDFGRGLSAVAGADAVAVNAGSIHTEGDSATGILLISPGGEVTNSGSIETFGGLAAVGSRPAAGVLAFGSDAVVRNTRTGSIETHDQDSPAVGLNIQNVAAGPFNPAIIAADTESRLENEGLIRAAQTAVLGGTGDETVVNSGRIIGDVRLGGGEDIYVAARGGELRGAIFTGDGDDTIVLNDGSGRTRVADFEAGAGSDDILDISAFGFANFAAVLGAAQQDGSDVVIRLDGNDRLVLSDVLLGALHQDDFLLIA